MNREESSLGQWLRARREALHITQADLGRRVGYSADMIRKIEAGLRWPTPAQAEPLAAALKLTPAERITFVAVVRHERPADWLTLPDDSDASTKPLPLPIALTSFIGREQVVADVLALLQREDIRLLTLTGVGGIGKTRLALRVAAACQQYFRDGVCFVPLAPLTAPEQVVRSIAQALGVQAISERGLVSRIGETLARQRVLLVLDNFEHVLDAAPVLIEWLTAIPHQRIVVTSRVVLRITGEHEYIVPSLQVPVAHDRLSIKQLRQYEAIQLFIERVQVVKRQAQLTMVNVADVVAICQLLDGIPLALELAAGRCKVLSFAALREKLQNRLAVLVGGGRDRHVRHRTIRATIEWSYNLLAPAEQRLFRWLGVFAGGCTLEQMEAICTVTYEQAVGGQTHEHMPHAPLQLDVPILDQLEALVDASMVVQSDTADGDTRFVLLETIREYALEQLADAGELEFLRERHARLLLALATRAEPAFGNAGQERWFDRFEHDKDNFWLALEWATTHAHTDIGLRLVNLLYPFIVVRGYLSEGRAWTEQLLARSQTRNLDYARALNVAGDLAANQGDFDRAYACYQECLTLCRELHDQLGTARVLASWSEIARAQGDQAIALPLAQESVDLYRTLDDRRGLAFALNVLSAAVRNKGDYAHARTLVEESLAIYRDLGDQPNIAWLLYRLGIMAYYQGDSTQERACYEESLAIRRTIGDKSGIAASLNNLGLVALYADDYAQAQAYYDESLVLYRELGDRNGTAMVLANLGRVAWSQCNLDQAVAFCEEALHLFRQIRHTRGIAASLHRLAVAVQQQGHLDRASSLLQESIGLSCKIEDVRGTAASLTVVAGVIAAYGALEPAAHILGTADARLSNSGEHLDAVDQKIYDQINATIRQQLEGERFRRAWENGQSLSPEQAITYAIDQGVLKHWMPSS